MLSSLITGTPSQQFAAEGDGVTIDFVSNFTTTVQIVRWYFQLNDDCMEITGANTLLLGSASGSLLFSPDGLTLTIFNARLPMGGLFYRVTVDGGRVLVDFAVVITLSKSVTSK